MNDISLQEPITLENGSSIGLLSKDPNLFLNRSITLYGGSGTGKTTVAIEILYILSKHIPSCTAYIPSSESSGDYNGIIPRQVIKSDVKANEIRDIYKNQQRKTKIYNFVNNVNNLRNVFNLMKEILSLSSTCIMYDRKLREIYRENQIMLKRISMSSELAFDQKKREKARITDLMNNAIIKQYKDVLNTHKSEITTYLVNKIKQSNIDKAVKKQYKDYIKLLEYININPRLLIIFDDCIDELNAINKKSKDMNGDPLPPIIDVLYQKGRHNHITIITITQHDSKLSTPMRSNSYISIFTDPECLERFVTNKANSIAISKRKHAEAVSKRIFDTMDEYNHKKVAYYRNGNDKTRFTYVLAKTKDEYGQFRFGSHEFWQACQNFEDMCNNDNHNYLYNST